MPPPPPLNKFEFILSKLRFRDRSAIFVEKPENSKGPAQKIIWDTPFAAAAKPEQERQNR